MEDECYLPAAPQPPPLPAPPAATAVLQPPSAPPAEQPVRCPRCGSQQFFGARKVSGWGWFWLAASTVNLLVSIPLMFLWVGFLTALLSPVMGLGFYFCRRHVNTCARCKRDF